MYYMALQDIHNRKLQRDTLLSHNEADTGTKNLHILPKDSAYDSLNC